MFHLLKQFHWTVAVFLLASCAQDPLKNIPSKLREGVYNTGIHNQSNFDFLSSDAVRVTFNGSKDLTLPFKEGEESSHIINVQPLYEGFPYDIDVDFKDKNSQEKELFENFKWSYDKDKKEFVITWKPDKQFTGYQKYLRVKHPFFIKLKKKNDPNEIPMVIVKNINLEIEKVFETPEIIKIIYDGVTYEKMEDENFYEIPSSNKVNLRLNRQVVELDESKGQNYKFDPNEQGRGYPSKTVVYNSGKSYLLNTSDLEPTNERIYSRLKKPIYEKKEEEVCASSDNIYEENGKTICYVEIKDGGDKEMDLNLEIYESDYVFPKVLKYKNKNDFKKITFDSKQKRIYRRFIGESLCFKRSKGRDYFLKEEDGKANCYLQVNPTDTFFDKKDEDFYYFPVPSDKRIFYPLLKNQLEKRFRLMPKYLKLLIAGYKPIKINDPYKPINLISEGYIHKNLEIHVKSPNYTLTGPILSPEKVHDVFSPIIVNYISKDTSSDHTVWIFKYSLISKRIINNDYEKKYLKINIVQNLWNKFQTLRIGFTPLSEIGVKVGQPVFFVINRFPKVQVFYEEDFEKDLKDIKFFQEIKEEKQDEEVLRQVNKTSLSLLHTVKVDYVLPSSFSSFMNVLSLRKYLTGTDTEKNLEDLEDILDIKLKPYSSEDVVTTSLVTDTYTDTDIDAKKVDLVSFGCIRSYFAKFRESYQNIFKPVSCSCDPFYKIENGEKFKVTLRKECHFKVDVTLDSNLDKTFHASYHYGFNKSEISFKDELFEKDYQLSPLYYSVEKTGGEYDPVYTYPSREIKIPNRDFFFNLEPSIRCLDDSELEKKKCTLSYSHQYTGVLEVGEKDDFYMDVTCRNSNGEKEECFCDEGIERSLDKMEPIEEEKNEKNLDKMEPIEEEKNEKNLDKMEPIEEEKNEESSDVVGAYAIGLISKVCYFDKKAHGKIDVSLGTKKETIFLVDTLTEMKTYDIKNFKKTQIRTLNY